MEFNSDVKLSKETSYYFEIIEKFIGYDLEQEKILETPNYDLFKFSAYLGLSLEMEKEDIELEKHDETIDEKEKTLPRTILTRQENEMKELLLCVAFKKMNYNSGNADLQKIWNLESFSADKELYLYLIESVDLGSKYMASLCMKKIELNISEITKKIDKILEEKILKIAEIQTDKIKSDEQIDHELDLLYLDM